jgi:hypothetical protein
VIIISCSHASNSSIEIFETPIGQAARLEK